MLKVGDKVYHFTTMNRIGEIVNIYNLSNNKLMTTMGTTESRLIVEVKYKDDNKIYRYNMGDLFKSYD